MSETPPSVLQWLRLANRDVSDIWIGCVVTISASTFLALHLNVKPYKPPTTPGSLLARWWRSRFNHEFRRQLLWAIMMVIAPELLVGLSFGDWRAASIGLHIFKRFGQGHVREWTKAHASFANMGGLKLRMKTSSPSDAQFRAVNDGVLIEIFNNAGIQNTTFQAARSFFGYYILKLTLWVQRALQPSIKLLHSIRGLSSRYFRKGEAPAAPINGSPRLGVRPDTENIELGDLSARPEASGSGTQGGHGAGGTRSGAEASAGTSNPVPNVSNGATSSQAASSTNATTATSQTNHTRTGENDATRDLIRGDVTLYLNAMQIVVAQHLEILDEGPPLSSEDIEDKSKANPLAKGIAIISLFWFVLGTLIQIGQNEELTQLELSTFTYAICAVLAYFLYWTKPQAVETPIEYSVETSAAVRSVTHRDIRILKAFGGSPFLSRNFVPPFGMDSMIADPTEPIPTDISLTVFAVVRYDSHGVLLYDADMAGIVMGVVFGAMYCLGWNSTFPSRWELCAWRAASLLITASLIPYSIANAICTMIFGGFAPGKPRKSHAAHNLTLFALLGLYVGCRLFMVVEMIRALAA